MWVHKLLQHRRLYAIGKHGFIPALLYFLAFCLLTFPLITRFSSAFFAGTDDGLQNVWNVWWVNQAVRRPDLFPTIWYTNLLQWPFGTTLVGHTLNPFNGFLAVPLLTFLSLTAAYNAIVIFAFVMGGVTMYWLAYYLTRSYWPSLVAGFLLTFSNYHFAHYSQLQTISLEWLPLFLLCCYAMFTRPHPALGLAAALALWFVLLCDYYYFTYCILAALIIFLWYAIENRSIRFITHRQHLVPLMVFGGAALLLTVPQAGSLLIGNHFDPLRGAHNPTVYSLDLLALLVPGGFWLFSHWTQGYWSRLPGNITENSVFLALPVFVLIGYLWVRRKRLEPPLQQQLYLWSSILGIFFVLALGPVLHVAGTAVAYGNFMPYTLIGRVLPFLGLSGVPARMTVMVIIAASVLTAFALRELSAHLPGRRVLILLVLMGVLILEVLPAPFVTTTPEVPPYVTALARLPGGGVLDLLKTDAGLQLYYQTVHRKPISFGYLARLPTSVSTGDKGLSLAYNNMNYAQLWGVYRIRYILTHKVLSARADQPYMVISLLYSGPDARIYRLNCTCELNADP